MYQKHGGVLNNEFGGKEKTSLERERNQSFVHKDVQIFHGSVIARGLSQTKKNINKIYINTNRCMQYLDKKI